jgi:hypothetical protein
MNKLISSPHFNAISIESIDKALAPFTVTCEPDPDGGEFNVLFVKNGDEVIGRLMPDGTFDTPGDSGTGAVRYDTAQTLTARQQSQARSNIAVVGLAELGTAAWHNVTISTDYPSGGSDGDIWLRIV